MSVSKPVVCLDLGGPGEIATEECGIKVKATSEEQIVADLAKALSRLASSNELRRQMGNAGRQRVLERYDWDQRGRLVDEIYRDLKGSANVDK
jgi:glycosyltransferase involved in cell wall biosynthesis